MQIAFGSHLMISNATFSAMFSSTSSIRMMIIRWNIIRWNIRMMKYLISLIIFLIHNYQDDYWWLSPRVCASKTSSSATGSCTPRRSASAQRRTSAQHGKLLESEVIMINFPMIFHWFLCKYGKSWQIHDRSDGSGVAMSFGWNTSPLTNTALSLWRFGNQRLKRDRKPHWRPLWTQF